MTMTLTIDSDIALIHMDDGKANAVGPDFLNTITPMLDEAEATAKVIVLAGREGRFSAGFDLKIMQGAAPDEVAALVNRGGALGLRLFTSPLPVIAACTGHALAMGALLLLSCDTRIGSAGDFKIGLNETAIGMALPQFGIELPRARLKTQHLTRAVVQAGLYDPDSAVDAGYLDMVVDPAALMETAMATAAALKQISGRAYHANKLAIRKPVIDAISASLA